MYPHVGRRRTTAVDITFLTVSPLHRVADAAPTMVALASPRWQKPSKRVIHPTLQYFNLDAFKCLTWNSIPAGIKLGKGALQPFL